MAAKMKSANKAATKSEIYATLAEKTGLTRKQVGAVFDELSTLITSSLRQGPKLFALAGLVKFRVVYKPATAEKEGINPFTKQPMIIKAKPARNVVKVVPLKALKDMVK